MLVSSKLSSDGDTEDDDKSLTSLSRHNTMPNVGAMRLNKKMRSYKARTETSHQGESIREEAHPKQNFEPTFRMEPYQIFSPAKTKQILMDTLYEFLNDFRYPRESDSSIASDMTKRLTEVIVQNVKSLNYERYKIVCFVALGNMMDQSLSIASRCMWDTKLDTSATYTYQKDNFYCTAVVFGLYKE